MKKFVILILLFFSATGYAQEEKRVNFYTDLPPNPQAGHCYVRCLSDGKENPVWEDVDCTLLSMQELKIAFDGNGGLLSENDKLNIKRTFNKLIEKGVSIQLESHYNNARTDAQNMAISSGRSVLVGNYLVSLGLNPDFLKVSVAGSSANKVGISFRIINNSPDGFHYDAGKGFWCKPKASGE